MRKIALALALGASLTACGDDPLGPPGTLIVEITTIGLDRDAAYDVRIGGETHPATGSPASVVIGGVRSGRQTVLLEGLASNCTSVGGASRTVGVKSGESLPVSFVVACVAVTGSIAVISTPAGAASDLDGYFVHIGANAGRALGTSDSVFVDGLPGGDHTVTLSGLASNCTVSGANPRTVRVNVGTAVRDTARTVFAVTCVPVAGALRLTTRTTGVQLDPDGYSLTIDGLTAVASVAINATATIQGILAGSHSFRLLGLAPNCTATSPNPVVATVIANGTLDVAFDIVCARTRGNVRVVTRTTGSDLDADGYSVLVDGAVILSVPANGITTSPDIEAGGHAIRLDGIAQNCTVGGLNPRPLAIVGGETAEVEFAINCVSVTRITVTASTSGVDPDRDGYFILLVGPSATSGVTVSATGTATSDPLPRGTFTATLLNLAPNCEVTGSSVRTVVATDATAQVSYAVTCATLERIAYAFQNVAGNTDIYTANADGSNIVRLTTDAAADHEPSWSSTGRIAFRSDRGNNSEIWVMNENGTGQARLTTNAAYDHSPTWSPDGTKIAFVSDRGGVFGIYVMDASGANVVRVSSDGAGDFDPAWSPDGTKIVFTRSVCGIFGCLGNVWVMDANGGNAMKLTDTGLDTQPTWSPDGARIAFSRVHNCASGYYYYSCERNIVVMNRDGTQVTSLLGDGFDESDPSWSPGGARLAIGLGVCGYYGCSPAAGIRIIRLDGSDPIHIITGVASNPVFRR